MSTRPGSYAPRLRLAAAFILTSMVVVASSTLASATPGGELWVKRYDGPASGADYVNDTAISPDGATVFVTGSTLSTTTGQDMTTIAYDSSDGTQMWSKHYKGPGDGDDAGLAVGVSPDGSAVFVTGGSERSPGDRDYVTFAYSASDGAKLWSRRYQGAGGTSDQADGLQVAPDGQTVFVTGPSYASASAATYVTIAYHAIDGAQLWARSTSGYPQRNALSVSQDGTRVFMSGAAIGSTSVIDFTTVALDASTGHKLWGRRFNGKANGNDFGTAVGVSPSGTKVYVTGSSQGSTENDFQYVTIAYGASDGAQRWLARYDRPGEGLDVPFALDVAPDGSRIVVTGSSGGTTTDDFTTIAYDPMGARVWAKRYDGPGQGYDVGYDVAVTADSARVIATGGSDGSTTGSDYVTLAYDAVSGTKLWASRYDGPDGLNDTAKAVAVAPDGSAVFIAGESDGTATLQDYATVAYSLT